MFIQAIVGGHSTDEFPITGPISVGRQALENHEPGPFAFLPAEANREARLIVAATTRGDVSRQTLRLECIAEGRVRISNLARRPLRLLPIGQRLDPGQSAELLPPLSVEFTDIVVRVSCESIWGQLEALSFVPAVAKRSRLPELPVLSNRQLDELVRWMQHTVAVFQSTLLSAEFVPAAAEALVNIVRLDSGRVFLRQGECWAETARFPTDAEVLPPSRSVLERVRANRQTFWKVDEEDQAFLTTSVSGQLSTVVAAPILDASGEVVGVLYGEKKAHSPTGKPEALLVEMLASGIATGLSRQRQEEKTLLAEELFAQFFSRDLAKELAHNPGLLDGRETTVSILFADIRGFSRVSEQLGPAETVRWLSDVCGELSVCVVNEGGVLVDYIGDEVLAMWGAPTAQPNHAERSVQAALAMLAALPKLNERWMTHTGEECRLGIGVNTGLALVGNIGSAYKFKYGALGNTVNVASRVQGLTRYLKRSLLITGETFAELGPDWIGRRVCCSRVVNIARPINLYEVAAADSGMKDFFLASAAALTALEEQRFAEAARTASELLEHYPGDGPLQLILSRAAAAILEDGKNFDPVWAPPGK
jgi:adenylate cyclase